MIELDFRNQKNPQQYMLDIFSSTQKAVNASGDFEDIHGFMMPKSLRFLWHDLKVKPYSKVHIGNGLYECSFRIRPSKKVSD